MPCWTERSSTSAKTVSNTFFARQGIRARPSRARSITAPLPTHNWWTVDAATGRHHRCGHDHRRRYLAPTAHTGPPCVERRASSQRPPRVDDPGHLPAVQGGVPAGLHRIGLITLAFQVTSSLLQPLLGYVTDRRPWAFAMVAGMGSTLIGVLGLAFAGSYAMVLLSVALVGLGSAVFHPERRVGPSGRRVTGLCAGHIPDRRACRSGICPGQ